jgi:hypothetical protein
MSAGKQINNPRHKRAYRKPLIMKTATVSLKAVSTSFVTDQATTKKSDMLEN